MSFTLLKKLDTTSYQSVQFFSRTNRFYSQSKQLVGNHHRKIIQLEPGLVLLKNGLSPDEQINLVNLIIKLGSDSKTGFWKIDKEGNKVLNSSSHRGRMFNALKIYPEILSELPEKNLKDIIQTDKTLKFINHTHLITLFYKTLQQPPPKGYIPWHQDNGDNDGQGDYPVLSINLGDSCEFLISKSKPKISTDRPLSNPINLAHRIILESGDLLVFGGPCREIWHAIFKINANSAPLFLPAINGRFNLTYRYTPHIFGDEERFAQANPNELPKDNQFYKLTKMK